MTLGLKTDPIESLEGAYGDLILLGIIVDRKACNFMKTNTNIAFIGAPSAREPEVSKYMIDAVLPSLKYNLME